jgi:two-component sensor histidine kinase
MATPGELARLRTELSADEVEHLQRLLGSWSLLSDLSFSDLLLVAPVAAPVPGSGPQLVVLGQIRPNNRATVVTQDFVGQTVAESRWESTAEALHAGHIVKGTIFSSELNTDLRVWNVPVRFGSKVIGVLMRVRGPLEGEPSPYERVYLGVFERICVMVADSAFPYPDIDFGIQETPRVGDGSIVVDGQGRIEFATPNAVNALHRMGAYSPPEGSRFEEVGLDGTVVSNALKSGSPVLEEIERHPDVSVLVQVLPLLTSSSVTGALILLRDVTDLRRLGRLVLSKDAAIREVHHRVKNNLQTISALLRLQARRTDAGEGRLALLEAERRVRSIAIVHEILSREPGDQIPFAEMVSALVAMAEDSVVGGSVEIVVDGDLGEGTVDVATPFAVALAELLQNAVEHAFRASGPGIGQILVRLRRSSDLLLAEVRDSGPGLPEGFDIDASPSLGLSIVRDLVTVQLGGRLILENVHPTEGHGAIARIEVPYT